MECLGAVRMAEYRLIERFPDLAPVDIKCRYKCYIAGNISAQAVMHQPGDMIFIPVFLVKFDSLDK
jgi:hypothetical protein